MLRGISTEKLKLLNELMLIPTVKKENSINRYFIKAVKKSKSLYIIGVQPQVRYSVLIKALDDSIEQDCEIPIYDCHEFKDILDVIDDEEVEIIVQDKEKIVNIISSTDNITMPIYEESEKEKERREMIESFLSNKSYGEENCKLTLYEKENKEDKEPDAVCTFKFSKLNIKKLSNVFSGDIIIQISDGALGLSIGGKRSEKAIVRSLDKEHLKIDDKDNTTKIDGKVTIRLQDASLLSYLSQMKGFVNIDLKDGFPILVRKKLEDDIGFCYLISIMEEE